MNKVLRNINKLSKRFVTITINGQKVDVASGSSVYDATCKVLPVNQRVPTLCHHPYVTPDGNCRICLVEDQHGGLIPSCVTEVTEGMEIQTNSQAVNDNIKSVLKFMLSSHPLDCPTCDVNGECDFQDLLAKFDVSPKDLGALQEKYIQETLNLMTEDEKVWGNNALILDPSKCIKCTRCIRVCDEIMNMNILGMKQRGQKEHVSCFEENEDFDLLDCIGCGQCTHVCPTGAIRVNSDVNKVDEWLKSGKGTFVVQTAPAVRVTISEDLNLAPGDVSEGQMVSGLKELGFDYVFDTDFTADLTIMEEGYELISRVQAGGPFPMFTSCCPAWINMAEKVYPEYLPNLSTCKSPQQMMGALIKKYWADKAGVQRDTVKVVSIMPCTAKKDECVRPNMAGDVDVVLTTRELARLFKLNNIDVGSLDDVPYDDPLGESTGAGVIFGATGGVMEAAVRTAYEVIVGEALPDLNFTNARGLEGIKEATVQVGDIPLKIAIVHQGKNIHKIIEKIKNGEEYHFIEIMCCPGGCIGGGGNPKIKNHKIALQRRSDAIYSLDEKHTIRKSHENPSVQALYTDFLEAPLGHMSHELLHCTYTDRKKK